MIGGCSTRARVDYGRAYPIDKPQQRVADIHVKREGTSIVMTNTSDRSFGESIMWINGEFSRTLDGLAVGQTRSLSLGEFRNEFNEPFRAGGFFATVPPADVVLAQLETPDELVGLIVVRGQAER